MNDLGLKVEVLIEFRGMIGKADDLAGRIKTNGGKVTVGNANGRRNGHYNGEPRALAIWFIDSVGTYKEGAAMIRKVTGIVAQFESPDSEIVFGKSGVYDINGNEIYRNGHSK